LNPAFTYLLILVASILGPLALSFDNKVSFYRSWKYVFMAMILPAAFYIAWDCWFTKLGVWEFNRCYIIGTYLYNLPVEEVLFFFVVPYCCIFIYECIRIYFPSISKKSKGWTLVLFFALVLLAASFMFRDRDYSFTTFIFLSATFLLMYIFRKHMKWFKPFLFFISYGVILLPFLLVNGFLTAIPVVIYNDAENLGTRLYTIPIEDIFYGMLLFLLNIVIFEKLRDQKTRSSTPSHE